MSQSSLIPRSVWPVLVLLLVALAWLRFGGNLDTDPVLLVPVDPVEIVRLQVLRADQTTELRREEGGRWSLHGSLSDHLDDGAVDDLLAGLTSVHRAGTSLDPASAASYGLEDEAALEVTVVAGDGRSWVFVFGVTNPVTDIAYMKDVSGGTIHLVGAGILARLHRLPDSVRAKSLWPAAGSTMAVRTVVVDRERFRWRFERDSIEQWWWHADEASITEPLTPAAVYQEFFTDRRRVVDGGVQWRADDRRLRNLLAALDRSPVMAFHPTILSQLGIDGQTSPIGLVLGDGELQVSYLLGAVNQNNRLAVWRGGASRGLDTRPDLREFADVDLSAWLHGDALTIRLAAADSFRLAMPTVGSVVALPLGERGWSIAGTDDPILGDLAHVVDRLAMIRVLEPEANPSLVFDDQPRLTVTTWQRGPGMDPVQHLEVGVSHAGDSVVAWRPSDGFRAEIDRTLLVSGRNYLKGRTP